MASYANSPSFFRTAHIESMFSPEEGVSAGSELARASLAELF